MKTVPNAARVREVLAYDSATGVLTWRLRRGRRQPGDRAGMDRGDGYWKVKLDQYQMFVHRLAWLHAHGEWPAGEIDHINGDPSDNRLANLRDVSASLNQQNRRLPSRGKDLPLGVHLITTPNLKRPYRAQLSNGGKTVVIGWFTSAAEAALAYVEAKRKLHEGCTL